MGKQKRGAPRRDESLARDQRIRRSAEFQGVMSSGSRGVGKYLVAVWCAARGHGMPSRVGVVASRRVGGAVRRSRAKRLLREVYRRTAGRPEGDVVLIARSGIGAASWDSLVRSYQQAIRKATRKRLRSAGRAGHGARRPLLGTEGGRS